MGRKQIWTGSGSALLLLLTCACCQDPEGSAEHVPAGRGLVVTEIDQADLVNQPPKFVSMAPLTARGGQPYAYGARVLDPDGDEVRYRLVEAPAGAALEGSAVKWVPRLDQVGKAQRFTLRAVDEYGGAEDQAWEVIPRPGFAPEFHSRPPGHWQGGSYTYRVRLGDAGGDVRKLKVRLASAPPGAALTGSGRHWTLTWTPRGGELEARFILRAVDETGAVAEQNWKVRRR